MKKVLIVEVEYQKLEQISLESGVEIVVENMLSEYAESKLVSKDFTVNVKEVNKQSDEI